MDKGDPIDILAPVNENDKEWLHHLWVSEFGGETVISKGKTHHVKDMLSLIAWVNGIRVGAATYRLGNDYAELVSINALVKGSGIGSQLIAAVENTLKQSGLSRIWVITTNDNVDALRFYQRRGYRIAAVYPDAVTEARKLKTTIPLVGFYDIPIRDEIELEKIL
ncbi:GNAT family N-acetyltransferase [Paenibacillus qinlingensis]|uniref:N-acetylglutamate synthase-like GNAT family acetyltransferase n=1 Tax=Paenibacillus qinlingensis TaxID=1837343 RepID=A0ABU1NRU8_9BACL|nr:GNAT family N-acetyltransferase [Paenibacillus qinlingensis]MDR6550188.1 N-acetylglutamate synthase-like GNAT family acetyltransferase [Paenibacillus qinlingensis]